MGVGLGLEFDWAARAYARVAGAARRVGGGLRKLLPLSRRGTVLMLVVAAVLVLLAMVLNVIFGLGV
jgi:hypothetical protein